MAQKQKSFWYVIVMTDYGPVFVTSVDYSNKTAHWNKKEKPMEFNKSIAQDLCLGLSINFHTSFAVCVPYELTTQPYVYDRGQFEWVWNKEEETEED